MADKIVAANEGLCVLKTKKFRDSGVEWDDLLNEARKGILQAIERFNLDRGIQFSTYACHWINKYLRLAVDNNRLIYLPDSAQRVAREAQRIIDEGVSDVKAISEAIGKTSEYVQDCIEMSRDVQRIPVSEDGTEMEFATPMDDSDETPIHAALARLDPTIADICIKRNCGWKFYEIAEYFQCSARHAQELYFHALETLRALLTPEPSVEQQSSPNPYEVEIPTQRLDRMAVFYTVGKVCDRIYSVVARLDNDQESHAIPEGGTCDLHRPVAESSSQFPTPLLQGMAHPSFLIGPLFPALGNPLVNAIRHTRQRMGRVKGLIVCFLCCLSIAILAGWAIRSLNCVDLVNVSEALAVYSAELLENFCVKVLKISSSGPFP
ncbi:sigma factor [Acaryochloris sp. IP29b_bin.137]|uniref:sigma factor n=1 Tax=Acaryochloris sp. IP29b_bin.137 TaxID=2969217 RepID=UPI00262D92EB|nr:sigma factor [Acaryochloris sp. IP29b_bin.137]